MPSRSLTLCRTFSRPIRSRRFHSSRSALRALLPALTLAGSIGLVAPVGAAGEPQAVATRLGQPITEEALAAWNIDIRTPDGAGLPSGSGNVTSGKAVYDATCASCHGAEAKGGPVFPAMVGGVGSFNTDKRVLTPGSMYPYAPILFDYVRRSMPMTSPQTLTNDQVYAVTAYLLHLNGLVAADATMDSKTLPAVVMPNRNGFIVDDRPDAKAERCMAGCTPIAGGS